MKNHQIVRAGERLPFTWANSKFALDMERGFRYELHPHGGSVLPEALCAGSNGYSAFLEFVKELGEPEIQDPGELKIGFNWYWRGRPILPGVAWFQWWDLIRAFIGMGRYVAGKERFLQAIEEAHEVAEAM